LSFHTRLHPGLVWGSYPQGGGALCFLNLQEAGLPGWQMLRPKLLPEFPLKDPLSSTTGPCGESALQGELEGARAPPVRESCRKLLWELNAAGLSKLDFFSALLFL
jgi:hypothetical protein